MSQHRMGIAIANKRWAPMLTEDRVFEFGANVINGKILQPTVAAAFGKQSVTLSQVIGGKLSA